MVNVIVNDGKRLGGWTLYYDKHFQGGSGGEVPRLHFILGRRISGESKESPLKK